MSKPPIGIVSVRNAIKKHGGRYVLTGKNVRVNGQFRGCRGFVTDTDTGCHVYFDTESGVNPHVDNRVLYRTADSVQDYTGGTNRFCDPTAKNLAAHVVGLLATQANREASQAI